MKTKCRVGQPLSLLAIWKQIVFLVNVFVYEREGYAI